MIKVVVHLKHSCDDWLHRNNQPATDPTQPELMLISTRKRRNETNKHQPTG
jgi:hypothetical protein